MTVNGWNRALITGASSGIGLAFAEQLAAEGTDLVVVARDEARLDEVAGRLPVDVEVLVADLADRDQLARVERRLAETERPVDLLINNAGFGAVGEFIDLGIEDETSVVAVNVVAVHRLAHAAGTAMASRGRGGIVNISSIAGFVPLPQTATYNATKAFVTSFSEALAAELGPQGVLVTCLCPGLTRTEFHHRADYDTAGLPAPLWQSAADVAAAGLRAVAEGKVTVVPGAHNKVVTGLVKVAPAPLRRAAAKLSTRRHNR